MELLPPTLTRHIPTYPPPLVPLSLSLALTAVTRGPGAGPSWSPGIEPPDALWLHRDESVPLAPAPQALGQDCHLQPAGLAGAGVRDPGELGVSV